MALANMFAKLGNESLLTNRRQGLFKFTLAAVLLGSALFIFALPMVLRGTSDAQPTHYGIAVPALSDAGYVFDTAEVHDIRVTVLAKGFASPFAIEPLPDGDILIVERGVGLRLLNGATGPHPKLEEGSVPGVPADTPDDIHYGVTDIALHPDFAHNHRIYFTFNRGIPERERVPTTHPPGYLEVMRGLWADGRVTEVETIYSTNLRAYAGGSRVLVDRDGKVWVATSGIYEGNAQNLANPYGKVLRLNEDGSIPPDNPLVGREGADPAIYSYGHREQHAMTRNPVTGQVLTVEHGPNGGDEANFIKPGGNYGWPDYTFGRDYDGSDLEVPPYAEGIEKPLLVWLPSIAPSGALFYAGDKFPAWKGNLLVGSAQWGEIQNTGSLQRVVFNEELGELRREALLQDLHHRVRDVQQGPDGNLYILTDGPTNAVLRIAPKE